MTDTNRLEIFRQTETPFYYYDMDLLRTTVKEYARILESYGYQGHYALKANTDPRIVQEMVNAGIGADCVSGNEVLYAVENGFNPDRIVFSGVGKTDREIADALNSGIHCFNCESVQEMEVMNGIAASMGKTAPVALRINPDIDAHTHRYITTGRRKNKFGIYETSFGEVFRILETSRNLKFLGLHFHIGSQIRDLDVFRTLCGKVNRCQETFEANGFPAAELNMGGGLGIDYDDPDRNPIAPMEEYFRIFHESLITREGQTVHFETGRALVAQCASLISRVLYVKESEGHRFIILDAGMNDLIRPALYNAHHRIMNLESTGRRYRYDVVGPICESSDVWQKGVSLPETKRGDLFAIRSTGAYGQVMSMTYNMKNKAKAYYSDRLGI